MTTNKDQTQMADWLTVRHDPTWTEPLDPEIIPLCDALNAARFITTSSCCGHGGAGPYVWFEHSTDERIDRMARYVMTRIEARGDYQPHFAIFQRETRISGYAWIVELHLNNVYHNTPTDVGLAAAVVAINDVTELIGDWATRDN